jgi:hypothetical protein
MDVLSPSSCSERVSSVPSFLTSCECECELPAGMLLFVSWKTLAWVVGSCTCLYGAFLAQRRWAAGQSTHAILAPRRSSLPPLAAPLAALLAVGCRCRSRSLGLGLGQPGRPGGPARRAELHCCLCGGG